MICPSRPPAEDCSSFSVNLFFCISKNLNFVGLHSKLLTLEVMNVRFSSSSSFYTFIQLHTHHHLPICIKSLIWTLPFSFHSTSLHRCANVEGLNIPTSAIKGTYLVLVTQYPTSLCHCHTVSGHSLNVIFYNNNVTFVIWWGSICCNSDMFSSKFLHISNFHHLVNFCVVHCVYFFCYFCISERRLYFNSMLEYVVEFVTKTRGKNYKIH